MMSPPKPTAPHPKRHDDAAAGIECRMQFAPFPAQFLAAIGTAASIVFAEAGFFCSAFLARQGPL